MSPFALLSARARSYLIAVAILGSTALVAALFQLSYTVDAKWFVLVGLTLLTSSVTVKVPSVAATISVSETFVFASVIIFGWPAGTVIASLDGLVISFWLQKRRIQPFYRTVFNGTAPALSACIGSIVYSALGAPPIFAPDFRIAQILMPLAAFAATYFIANTALLSLAIALEQKLSAFRVWKENFMWLWLNFFSGASVAALLVSFGLNDGVNAIGAIWVVLPLLAISYLTYKTTMARIEDANKHLDQMNTLYMSTIETLAMAIDAKDQITHGHIRRVQTFAVSLAKATGITDQKQIRAIEAAALLHDMGKLAVPEYILNKPGALTPAEFERMKLHASVGADILSAIDFPYPVVPIVRHHHENWDGTGYPSGLQGSDIPIGARVLSVVDCFDALTSDRPYRPRLTDEDALKIISDRRGTMYDPLIVDTFLGLYKRLKSERALSETGHHSDGLALGKAETPFPRLAAITASAGESRAMYRLIQKLAAQPTLSGALSDVADELAALIPAAVIAVYTPADGKQEFEATHVRGSNADLLLGRTARLGERIVGWSAASGRSVLNADAVGEIGELARSGSSPLRSCLTVPVIIDADPVAVIAAFSNRDAGFRSEDQRIVEAIIRHITPVLERLQSGPARTPLARVTTNLELTPVAMIACRCSSITPAGTEAVGMALGVLRRHLSDHAQAQIVDGNDIFVGIDISNMKEIEGATDGLRGTLINAGLIQHSYDVVFAITPRDGTSLEHLLYACRQRLSSQPERQPRVH